MFLPSQIYDGVLVLESTESEEKKVKSLSRVQILVTPRTAAHQAPLSMRFPRQEYWSGVPLPPPPKCISHYQFPKLAEGWTHTARTMNISRVNFLIENAASIDTRGELGGGMN